jgi:hypothetical protein
VGAHAGLRGPSREGQETTAGRNKELDKKWKAKGHPGNRPYKLAVGDNHYSLKYRRCYVVLTNEDSLNPVEHVTEIIDAFRQAHS